MCKKIRKRERKNQQKGNMNKEAAIINSKIAIY